MSGPQADTHSVRCDNCHCIDDFFVGYGLQDQILKFCSYKCRREYCDVQCLPISAKDRWGPGDHE